LISLAALEARGITLRPTANGQLDVEGPLSDELIEELRRYKSDLLEALAVRAQVEALDLGASLRWGPDAPCRACGCPRFWRAIEGQPWRCALCVPPRLGEASEGVLIGGGALPDRLEDWPTEALDEFIKRAAIREFERVMSRTEAEQRAVEELRRRR
jgi:hypothetical protein